MKTTNKGFLISIEGIDGSGKSLLSHNIHNALKATKIILTKEPGGTVLGEKIRTILLEENAKMCAKSEFLLFAASRAEHFHTFVLPKLEEDYIIICDRLNDSSLVYQGVARGLSIEKIKNINSWAMNNRYPDLVFYLKLDPTTALERIKKRNIPLTEFEKETSFIEKTVEGFNRIFANRENVITLDARKTPEEITKEAIEKINHYLANK